MPHRTVYKKSTKGGAGAHGVDYQINILTLFLLEAYQNNEEFWLSTENEKGGKFDDVLLETNKTTILLQAKHKEDPEDKKNSLTYSDIFPSGRNKEDFNIPKYAKSFSMINKNFSDITAVILCTNSVITNKVEDDIAKYLSVKKMTKSHLFYFSNKKYYYQLTQQCKDLLTIDYKMIDSIDAFVEKFQLLSISDQSISARIKFLMEKINLFDASFDLEQAVSFLKENIKIWFESEKGTYLTRYHVEAFRSLYFMKKLEKLNVNMKLRSLDTTKLTCYVIQKKKNIYLHLLKLHKQLKMHKILMVDHKDPVHIKEKVISAFKLQDFVYIVIPVFREDYEDLKKVILNCVKITKVKSYKNIVFITDELKILARLCQDLQTQIISIVESVKYENFAKKTQNEISSSNIYFQGKLVTLQDVISSQINNILDESTLLKLLKKRKIWIFDYTEEVINFYINRGIFSIKEEISLDETQFCDTIVNETGGKIILITDSPGMGKTTLLFHLQKLLIERYNYLVLKIHLNECTRIFRNYVMEGKTLITLEELFTLLKNPTEFEVSIFNLPSKVIVMLDAFDEISPNYSNLVLNLVKSCETSENVRKVVITCRQHCEIDITDSIFTNCFSLNPFTVKEQREFLYRYWSEKLNLNADDKYKCEQYIHKLLFILTDTIAPNSWNLIGIPLQSQMVAHIFRKDCLEYIRSNKFEIVSLEKLNIAKLYERFLQEKKSIYIDEKTNAPGNALENILSTKFDKSIEEEHTEMAVQIIFDNKKHKYFLPEKRGTGVSKLYNFFLRRVSSVRSKKSSDSADDQVSLQYLLEMGILQKTNDSLQFIHRTFAEFLVAKHICSALMEPIGKQKLFNFLIDEVFLLPRYNTLRSFMNDILEDKIIPVETLRMCGEVTEKLKWGSYICLGLARNGHFNLLKIILRECDNCDDILLHRIGNGMDLLLLTLSDFSTFKLLAEKGADLSKMYGKGRNSLHFAVQNNSKDVVSYLIEKSVNINAQDDDGYTPIHYAASKNYVSVLKILLSNGADVSILNHYQESAVFSAVEEDSVDALDVLVQYGLNIDDKNRKNCTPLLTACFYSSYNCVNYLLDHGADTIVSNFGGFTVPPRRLRFPVETFKENIDTESFTVLHYAVLAKSLTLVKLLLTAGLDVEVKDSNGMTPLVLACFKGELRLIKYLLNEGSDVSSCDNDGCNALHYLAKLTDVTEEEVYLEVLTEILDKINDDKVCNEGFTALYYAVKGGNFVMIKLLLDKENCDEFKDFNGESLLNRLKSVSNVSINGSEACKMSFNYKTV